MKVIIEESGVTCTVEDEYEGETIEHAYSMCRQALLGVGYGEKSVSEWMGATTFLRFMGS